MGKPITLVGLIALVLTLAGCGCPSPEPKMNTQLKVIPSEEVVQPGEQFTVNIDVVPDVNVNVAGVQVDILFSEQALRVDSVEEGNLLNQAGDQTFFMPGTIGPSSVVKIVGVILGAGKSIASPGTFAILNCTALTAGKTSNFQLQNVIVGDKDANSLPLESPVIAQVAVAVVYDINLDGSVNAADLTLVYQAFGKTAGREDVKSDGMVDILDLILVAQHIV